jgi:mannose-6-phosphate isomerase-like protein (cupin superfamily)
MTVSCWCSTERIDASRSPPGRPKAILTVFVSAYPDGVPHPLHIHHDAIESFFIIEGAARFYVGGVVVDAEQGAFVSVPRGRPWVRSHRCGNPSAGHVHTGGHGGVLGGGRKGLIQWDAR